MGQSAKEVGAEQVGGSVDQLLRVFAQLLVEPRVRQALEAALQGGLLLAGQADAETRGQPQGTPEVTLLEQADGDLGLRD